MIKILHISRKSKIVRMMSKNYFCEKSPQVISQVTQLQKLNKILPMDSVDTQVLNDVVKYKVLEDSVRPTVEKLKEEVPEISKHTIFRDYIKSVIEQDKQEEILKKDGIVIMKNRLDVFHKYGIDTHHYKNFDDREYEVDIEQVLTKDLFEKQRVVDNLVEDNKQAVNDILGYYNNRFKFTKFNKYSYLIFQNSYRDSMRTVKLSLFKNISSVSFLSLGFYLINPYIMLLLLPEYFAIFYMCLFLNNLVDQIILLENKQSVLMRTFNLFGFRKEYPTHQYEILNLRYEKKVKNDVLNLNDKGFFFITRLIRRYLKTNNKDDKVDNFKFFHKLSTTGRSFLIPADTSIQNNDTNEELVLNLINRDCKAIMEYDYSTYEDRVNSLCKFMDEYKREYEKKHHRSYVSEEDKLKAEYSNFKGNRDFGDQKYELTMKRTDGLDGTYVNNGYR